MNIHIEAIWDCDVGLWSASSTNFFGLVAEAKTLDGLMESVTRTYVDLMAAAKKDMPSTVTFKMKCSAEPYQVCNLNVQPTENQLAAYA